MAFVPAVTFQNKMDIYPGTKKIELWYFGVGHTTGDIVVYFPEEKTAFIGDQVFVGRQQLIHSYKGGNSFAHVKTLTSMLGTLVAEKFYSGHSEVITRDEVQKHIDDMKSLQQKVLKLIEMNKTVDEVKTEFENGQSALVEVIFNEIKNQKY